jgi:general secretion pathway protein K
MASDKKIVGRARALRGRIGRHVTQRGVALIAVAGALAMLGALTTEFTTDADVEYEAAKNSQDEMRAHFLARSGVNLARLVIKVQTDIIDRFRNQIGDVQISDYVGLLIGAFCGSKDEVKSLEEMLVGTSTGGLKGLGLSEGQCGVEIGSDDGKINVNCVEQLARARVLQTQLEAMFYSAAYDEIFDQPDAEGYRRDRETQAAAIIDYIDTGSGSYGARGSAEAYGYENLRDSYKPKDNLIDTIDELRLVRGIDDRFWTLFGSAFTVYGQCTQNLGAIRDPNAMMAVIIAAAKDPDDPVLRDPVKLWKLAVFALTACSYGQCSKTVDFAKLVSDPVGTVAGGAGGEDDSGGSAAGAISSQLPEGVEIDQAKLDQVARVGERITYRVEASAAIGRVQKKITAVWHKGKTRQNNRPNDASPGAWVYWKEE